MGFDLDIRVRAILTDIEGTVTSPSYKKDVIIPYVYANLSGYVKAHRKNLEQSLNAVREDERNPDLSAEEVTEVLLRYIKDKQVTNPLRSIQGMVLAEGYAQSRLQAFIYEDVLQAFARWRSQGRALYIYSSLSVQEQRLFFSYAPGNISGKLFSGMYDTQIGEKKYPISYEKIAASMGYYTRDILFLTDNIEDAVTASSTGMQVIILDRQACLENTHGHRIEHDFDNILPEVVPA